MQEVVGVISPSISYHYQGLVTNQITIVRRLMFLRILITFGVSFVWDSNYNSYTMNGTLEESVALLNHFTYLDFRYCDPSTRIFAQHPDEQVF